jgi:UDP-N-acetyl-2-amino-2-deoxyglucuronate dehydrogenase
MAMPLGVGLIGLGMAVKSHRLALRNLEAGGMVSIIGGYSPSTVRRRAFAAQWGAPVFNRQDALLNHPGSGPLLVLAPRPTSRSQAAALWPAVVAVSC